MQNKKVGGGRVRVLMEGARGQGGYEPRIEVIVKKKSGGGGGWSGKGWGGGSVRGEGVSL